MIVEMGFIQVGADDLLIAVAKQTLGKGHADGVGLLRCHLAGHKGLDEVLPHHAAQPAEPLLCLLHLGIGGFTASAVNGRRKEMLFRFLWNCGVSNTSVQCGLFTIDNIIDTVIQPPANGKHLCVSHVTAFSRPVKAFSAWT